MYFTREWIRQSLEHDILPLVALRDKRTFSMMFDDEELAGDIIRRCPLFFRLASPRLRDMHDFALLGIRGRADNIAVVSERLRGLTTFIFQASGIAFTSINYICEPARSDADFWDYARGYFRFNPDDYPDEESADTTNQDVEQSVPESKPEVSFLSNDDMARYVDCLQHDVLLIDQGLMSMLANQEFVMLALKQANRLYHVLPKDTQQLFTVVSSWEALWV